MNYNRQTSCVHLYMQPASDERVNVFIDGKKTDLMALLITAARMDDHFHDAFLEGAEWLLRDETTHH